MAGRSNETRWARAVQKHTGQSYCGALRFVRENRDQAHVNTGWVGGRGYRQAITDELIRLADLRAQLMTPTAQEPSP